MENNQIETRAKIFLPMILCLFLPIETENDYHEEKTFDFSDQ